MFCLYRTVKINITTISVFQENTVNCENVDINHKTHKCVNKSIFSFDTALIMNLLKKRALGGLVFSFGVTYPAG